MLSRRDLALEPRELVAQILGRLVALLGVLLEAARDDPAEMAGQADSDGGHRGRRVLQDRRDHRDGRVAGERPLAGGHLVEDGAHREDVGARIDALALGLLGRHVGRGAEDFALTRQAAERRRLELGDIILQGLGLGELGEAEVEHLDSAFGVHHHVGGLEVAVGDAAVVGGGDSVGESDAVAEEVVEQQAAGRDQVREGLAVDELHGEEVGAVRFLDRVEDDDIGVVERRDGAGLALEAGEAFGVAGEVGRQDLQGNSAAELGVFGGVDGSHTAFTKEGGDSVVIEGLADHGVGFALLRPATRCAASLVRFRAGSPPARHSVGVRAATA